MTPDRKTKLTKLNAWVKDEEREAVQRVLEQFDLRKMTDEALFYQLCFCLCSPQTTFTSNAEVNKRLETYDFYGRDIPEEELQWLVRPVRFFRHKANRLLKAKACFPLIAHLVRGCGTEYDKRSWLVQNITGLGMKTASHFLRNTGAKHLAIIDTHIIQFLGISQPNTRSQYLRAEALLAGTANRWGMNVAEYDILLWQRATGTSWQEYIY